MNRKIKLSSATNKENVFSVHKQCTSFAKMEKSIAKKPVVEKSKFLWEILVPHKPSVVFLAVPAEKKIYKNYTTSKTSFHIENDCGHFEEAVNAAPIGCHYFRFHFILPALCFPSDNSFQCPHRFIFCIKVSYAFVMAFSPFNLLFFPFPISIPIPILAVIVVTSVLRIPIS